jgi:two-component system NarL family sensor kinase
VQECLTNIHRHAHSKSAAIRLDRHQDTLTLEVLDQGKGISKKRFAEIQAGGAGVGIRGMRERVRQFGGHMSIESDQSGTRVQVSLPIHSSPRRRRINGDEAAEGNLSMTGD